MRSFHTSKNAAIGLIIGSRYSGGAEQRQDVYLELVRILLEAGSTLRYPDEPQGGVYLKGLLRDASPGVAEVLREVG